MATHYQISSEFSLVDKASKVLDRIGFSSGVLNKTLGASLLKAQAHLAAVGQAAIKAGAAFAGVASVAITKNVSDSMKKYTEFESVLTAAGAKFGDMDVTSETFADDLDALSKAAQRVVASAETQPPFSSQSSHLPVFISSTIRRQLS
ncbi:MAG: hypothetical protein II921_09925 [Treponema sp.]|nr:hypothetical protein [Treponema sp.]